MFRSITHIKGFSHDDDDDSSSYLTMAARGIHECTLDSYFTANVPKEADHMDFSHSFSEIGSDFSFGLKCENAKREQRYTIHPIDEQKEAEQEKQTDKKSEKLSKLKQKYIVNDNGRIILQNRESKTNNNGKKLKMKWQSI